MVCCYRWHPFIKGGLISESFSVCIKSYKVGAKLLSSASSLYVDIAQDSDLAPFLEDLRQSKNLSHIKPPLVDLPLNSTSLFKLYRMKIFKWSENKSIFLWNECTVDLLQILCRWWIRSRSDSGESHILCMFFAASMADCAQAVP